jgi:hypothetical protein
MHPSILSFLSGNTLVNSKSSWLSGRCTCWRPVSGNWMFQSTFYMYLGEYQRRWISLACKLDLHPSILSFLSGKTLVNSKSSWLSGHWTCWRPVSGTWMFQSTFYMYLGELQSRWISLACKLGMHPSILSFLSGNTLVNSKSSWLSGHWTFWRPVSGTWMFQSTFYMYLGELQSRWISLACKLGMHPSILSF